MNEQTSRRTTIFDGFVALCQKDLGPLHIDWVEQLTLLAPSYQSKEFKDDTTSSSVNDTYFKTPWQKHTRNSQLASSPVIFHGLGLTPSVVTQAKGNHQSRLERENGSCSTVIQATISLGTTSVPHGKEIPSPSFDKSLLETPVLLHNTYRTPQNTSNQDYGLFTRGHPSEVTPQHISESLGAEFDPDMSWSSSLATPPSLSPTVIIGKAKDKDLPQFKPFDVHVPTLVRDRVNVNRTHVLPLIEEENNGYITVVDNTCRSNNRPDCLPDDSKGFEDETLCSSEVPWNQTVLEIPKDTGLQLPIGRVLNNTDNVSSMFFTDCPLSELRGATSCTKNGEKYSLATNIQSDNIESLEAASNDEKTCFESIAAKSSCNILFDHVNNSSVQVITTSVLMNEKIHDKCRRTDVYSQDKKLGKDLSTSNESSSDWSQLNLSELDESIVTSTTEICLENTDGTFPSNETNINQPQDCVPAKCIDNGLSWKKNGPSESSVSYSFSTKAEESNFKQNISVDSTKYSGTEVKCTTLKPTCRRTESSLISSLTIPELIQTKHLIETHVDSNSETVLTRPSPICKNEELQLKCVAECTIDSTKSVDLLCHQVKVEDPTNNHQDVSDTRSVVSDTLTNRICSVMDPDITTGVSLEDSEKCQLDEKDQSYLLCTVKRRPRKFLYFVHDSSNHQEQNNISLDWTTVQNRKSIPPSELLNSSEKSSLQKPAKPHSSVTGFTTSTTYEEKEAVTDTKCVPCVSLSDQLSETNKDVKDGNARVSSHVTVQTNHQVTNESRDVENRHANDKKWDDFVTPLNTRPASRSIQRRVRSTACCTVAKRLSLESEVKLSNHFNDKTEVNTVHSEVLNVNEHQVLQNKGRSDFQLPMEPISNINQSLTSDDCCKTKSQVEPNNQNSQDNCCAPVSVQLSTKQHVYTSVKLLSPETYFSDSLNECEKPISDIENCKTNLKINEIDKSVEPQESKLLENMEPLSPCFNKEKHSEEICFIAKEIPSHDKTPDACILVDNEKIECSDKSAGSHIGRKIRILASSLKTTNLITEIGTDPLLLSSGALSVQTVPESKLESMENYFGIVKKMCGPGYSSKFDLDTAVFPSTKETKLYENYDADKLSDSTVIEQEFIRRMKLKSQCDDSGNGTIIARETEIVSGDVEIPLVSEHCGFRNTGSKFNGFKTASEKHIKISTENLSKGKLLFKEIENMILEANDTQDTIIEHIPAQIGVTIQETKSTNSSDETEIENNSSQSKVPIAVIHKSLPHVFINVQTNHSSTRPKLFGQDTFLTASQTADVAELFSMLEDTGSQTEFTQFRKKSALRYPIKDDKLLVEASAPTLTSVLSEWKAVDLDENFEIQPSLQCISQQRATNRVSTEILKCLKVLKNRSENNQQIAEKNKQIKSNDCIDSVDSSNKTKPCVPFFIPNAYINDLEIDPNTDKEELVTKLNLAVLPSAACKNIHRGFCTASGSKIKYSSESLKKSADIFRDIDHDQGQTSTQTISNGHLGFLHDSSTMENDKLAEDKLGDVTHILTSKTYDECADIHLTVNNTNTPSPILGKEKQVESKIVGNNKQKSSVHIANSKIVTISKEILNRGKSLMTEDKLLHESENKKSGSPCSMKESTCMPQFRCSGTKNIVNNELVGNEVESTNGNMCIASAAITNPAIEIEDVNEIKCFWETSRKIFSDSMEYRDKAKLFDNKECCSEFLYNTKQISERVHEDRFPKTLVNCQSAVKNGGSKEEIYEQPGNVKGVLNVPICAVTTTTSVNNISMNSGIIVKESQVSSKKEKLPSPVEQAHLPGAIDMKSFQTASGKIVSICKASLIKARAFFAEESLPFNTPETFSTAVPVPHVDAQFIDDTIKNTATEQELDKSKISGSISSRIKQGDLAIAGKDYESPTSEPVCRVLVGHPIGFSTASGKSLQVSEESLRKCKQLFSEIEDNKDDFEKILEKDLKPEIPKTKSSGENFNLGTNVSLGFNTASGKRVLVSNGARQKGKSMLKEFDDMNDGPLNSLEYSKDKIYEKTQELVSSEADLYMSGCQAYRSITGPIQQRTSTLKNCSDKVSAVCDDFQVETNGSKINDAEVNTGPSKPLSANVLNSNFQIAERKEVIVKESNISVARPFLTSEEERTVELTTGENNDVGSGGSSNCDADNVSVEGRYVLKSDLDAHSTKLENFMENEALESAKALLEDDLFGSTSDQEVPLILESMNQSIDKSEYKLGKRLRSEEKPEKEGPPPKRTLLADFNRSLQNDYNPAFRSLTGSLEGASRTRISVDSGAMMKMRQVIDNEDPLSVNCHPIQQEPHLSNSVTGMKGFQTASGKTVSVCTVSLAKAKAFFAEEDFSMNAPETSSTAVSPPDIGAQFIDDAIKNTTTEQNNKPDKNHISGSHSNHLNLTEQDDFEITGKVREGTISEPPCQVLAGHPIGFCTASGKSVQVSEESLRECKKYFSEIEDNKIDFQRTPEKDSVPEQTKQKTMGKTYNSDIENTTISFGFNTASGRRVPVSNDALQKAKFKLKEFDDMNDGSWGNLEYPKSKIYEKTLTLVSEPRLSAADDPSLNGHPTCTKHGTSQKSPSKNCSERFLNVPDDFQEETNGSKINDVKVNSGLSKSLPTNGLKSLPTNGLNSKICMVGFQTAHGKDVLVEESNLAAARSFLASEEESKASENVGVASYRLSNCNADSIGSHALKSDVNVHSKMVENYIENEMLESAKALLEDDPFDSTSDHGVQSNVECMNQTDRTKLRMGKRLRTEEKLAKEGLHSKRQLLSYFDRTIQNDHKLRFKSSITNPEGIFCDRRKFMYNVPLQPLICGPSKDSSTSSLVHQQLNSPNITFPIQEQQNMNNLWFHHESKSPNGQDAVFVASFQKHSVSCVEPRNSKQRSSKPTKMFVPPFKTQSNAPQIEQFENTNNILSMKNDSKIIIKNNIDQNNYAHGDRALQNDGFENVPTPNLEQHGVIVKGSVQMAHNLQCARDLQEIRLIKKRRQTVRPEPGNLYRIKHSGAARKSLHTTVEGMFPASHRGDQLYVYGISRSTLSLQGENAESFCINCREFFSEELMMAGNGIQLADGEWLIPDHNGMAGKHAFYRALLDTPGVDPKLITESWTYNHYKWIVWKLAAMETAFPKQFGSRCLTPEMILLQLKYRYDVEIDKSCRSAIRKIMERDDTAAKTLILCVSKIISMGVKSLQSSHNALDDTVKQSKEDNEKSVLEAKKDLPVGVIEVNDGWYGIKVLLDHPLTALLQKKKLVVGQKIVVHGAELTGSQDACTPLEAPESLMLKISANSTRRARWYAKLGFHYDPRPFSLPLSSLFGDGGMVGCVDVIIQRTYSMQWMEKKCNGVCVFRNERAEDREAQIHCEKEQRELEALCAKIESDLQEKYKMERKIKREHRMQRLNKQQIMKLQDGVELYEAVQNSLDPSSLEMCLNEQQMRALNNYRQLLNEQKQSQIEAEFRKALECAQSENGFSKRDASPVWKLLIVDYKGQDNNAVYMLNIWRPVAELHSLLKEGKRYRIYNLNTSCCKSWLGSVNLQLTATRKTRYQQLQPSPEMLEKRYHPRQAVVYNMLYMYNPSFTTVCKEIDLVGYVIYISEKIGAPMVYLANENQDLVVVKFWASLNQLALEDTVKLGALIIASNLQWRSDSYMDVPKLFAGELSSFSANAKEGHLREMYNKLKSSVQHLKIFLKDTEEKVMALLKTINTPTGVRSSRNFGVHSYTPIQRTPEHIPGKSSTEFSLLDTEDMPQTPLTASDSGYRSTLGTTNIVPPDSLSYLKKKGLSFLSRIPSPTQLSPLCISVPRSIQKGFRPPRSCITPQSSTNVKPKESSDVQTPSLSRAAISKMTEENWIPDEELAMINTQDLCDGLVDNANCRQKIKREQTVNPKNPAVLPQNIKNDIHSNIEIQNSSAALEAANHPLVPENHSLVPESKRNSTEETVTLNTCEGVYQSEENAITQNLKYEGNEVQHEPGKLLLCRKKLQQRRKRKRY